MGGRSWKSGPAEPPVPGPHRALACDACTLRACDRRYIRRNLIAPDALSHDRLRNLLRHRLHGELAPQPLRGLVEALDDRPELRLLRLGRVELLPPPAPDDGGGLLRRHLGPRHA